MVSQRLPCLYQGGPRRIVKTSIERNRYSLEPAVSGEVGWIAQLEQEMYKPDEAIPGDLLEEWFARNPGCFSILKTDDEIKIGHVDILPVHPAVLEKFVHGDIVERDIRGDDLYSPTDKNSVRELYVESVAILLPPGRSKAPAVLYLMCHIAEAMERICNLSRIENMYAIAATAEGAHFLGRLGFEIYKAAESRRDRHNLFMASFQGVVEATSGLCKRRYR
jgi:hypothetical protein